ncbi:hypothetical protein BJ170DRAFT_294495 [Xylariales sp. AK1849]|nr:hypothetical protein BJ170DRAFT_294495 [Xylariales sp. AK1849]
MVKSQADQQQSDIIRSRFSFLCLLITYHLLPLLWSKCVPILPVSLLLVLCEASELPRMKRSENSRGSVLLKAILVISTIGLVNAGRGTNSRTNHDDGSEHSKGEIDEDGIDTVNGMSAPMYEMCFQAARSQSVGLN